MPIRKEKLPKISVIIPVHSRARRESALKVLKKVDYPFNLIEVFIVYGENPSRQRNMAAAKAKGDIFYFLDNDSEIDKKALKKAVGVFSGKFSPVGVLQARGFSFFPKGMTDLIIKTFFSKKIYHGEIGAVGGPNIWLKKESFWASMAGITLESFFVHYLMAARYRPIGPLHRVSEKELILCNLAVKREAFEQVGGFSELLYPNEENELLNRLEKAGYQLIYHPGMMVFRPRRQTLQELLGAFFNYGRGRMEQARIEGVWANWLLLIPLLFFFYLILLVTYRPIIAFLPLVIYLAFGLASALGFSLRRNKAFLAFFLPLLFLVSHLSYGIGLVYGLLTDLKRRKKKSKAKTEIVVVKKFGQRWKDTPWTDGKDFITIY